MARVVKYPSCNPPFGKTPLKHGAKIEIISINSQKKIAMDPNGAINCTGINDYNHGKSFVVSQIGAAVMLQCPNTGLIIGADQGYLYGFRANQNQAALRVYYHEDSGAIEFESCAIPGKFLAFDRRGNIIPLGGKTEGVARRFAVRMLEVKAAPKQPKSTLESMFNKGMKMVDKTVNEGATQVNFERHKLRGIMTHGARVRLRSETTGKYLAIMANGIVHGNGDQSDCMIVNHCTGLLRYSFQSEKYRNLFLCVTLDNITWAMSNPSTRENPMMVWEVDRCRNDGAILFRRNTMLNTCNMHQYLGIAPNGKPTATLIDPEDMGNMFVEGIQIPMHAANNAPVPLYTTQSPHPGPPQRPAPPQHPAPPAYSSPTPITPAAVGPVNYGAPPPPGVSAPPPDTSPASDMSTPLLPPGALLFDGSIIALRNNTGYLSVSRGEIVPVGTVNKDCDWKVHNSGTMEFKFENCKNGGFIISKDNDVKMGKDAPESNFQVIFNPNGSVTFQSVASDGVYIGRKDPEIFLEIC